MPYLIRIISLIILSSCLLFTSAHAQFKGGGGGEGKMDNIGIRSDVALIMVRPLETFGHKLLINNNSDEPLRFSLRLQPNKYFRLVNASTQTMYVSPFDSTIVGLKFLNVNARVNGIYTLYVDLVNKNDELDKKTYEFNVEVVDGTDQQFVITPLLENVLLQKNVRTFDVPVLFKNLLPDTKDVWFEIQNPSNSPIQLGKSFHNSIKLPAKDTLIKVNFITADQLEELSQQYRSITVLVKNDKGDIIGMFTVTPGWLFSKGTMFNPGMSIVPTGKILAEANFTYLGKGSSSSDIRISKPMINKEDPIAFNLFYQQYQPVAFRQLTDTWLQYQGKQAGVRVGSVADFHELSLYGRGIKSTLAFDEEKKNNMEVWAVDQEYNLLKAFTPTTGTRLISTRFTHLDESDNRVFDISSSYFERKDVNSKGHLHFANYHKQLSTNQELSIMAGGSIEKFNYLLGDTTLPGYAMQIDYSAMGKKWQTIVSGYKASRDYAGAQQGSFNINAVVTYALTQRSSLSYHLLKNTTDRPGYLPQAIQGRFYYNNTLHELNASITGGHSTWYVKPYLFKQGQLYTYDTTTKIPETSTAPRLQVGTSGNAGKIGYNFYLDAGTFGLKGTTISGKSVPSYRVSGSFAAWHLVFNTTLQKGPYFLNELWNNKNNPASYYSNTLNLSYSNRFLSKLDWQASISANNSSNWNGWGFFMINNLDYKLGNGFSARASIYQGKIGNLPINTQVRIGVRKTFDWNKNDAPTVTLRVRVYEDRNDNKQKDADEKWMPDVLVRVDEMVLVSDKQGAIIVKNIKKGWHKMSVLYGSSRQQNFLEKEFELDKNEKMELAVPPQYVVKGRVVEQKSKYLMAPSQMEGIKISFLNAAGKEQITYTNMEGEFTMQLAAGTYRVSIPQLKKQNAPNSETTIVVDPLNGYTPHIELTWVNNERQVEVKKISH